MIFGNENKICVKRLKKRYNKFKKTGRCESMSSGHVFLLYKMFMNFILFFLIGRETTHAPIGAPVTENICKIV